MQLVGAMLMALRELATRLAMEFGDAHDDDDADDESATRGRDADAANEVPAASGAADVAVCVHLVSQHLVWALRLLYWEPKGQIITKQEAIRVDIKAGVGQCALGPRLFFHVFLKLKKWREQLQNDLSYQSL